ncbi:hypothetical protein [Streptomyces agglomeratus]|uniref:hypothetical protein n=1 Tax=Streptomyces agglomeratus TaxID=285458 RepID=UPI00114CF46D|nr:hypothetical protein [Streptomyces agglomeratus]
MTTLKALIKQMNASQPYVPPAWQSLHESPAWRLLQTPAWSLSQSASAQLRSAMKNADPPPAFESLHTWAVLQQQIHTSLSMLSQLQPPVLPPGKLQEAHQIIEAFPEAIFAQLTQDLPTLADEDDDEIQALLDRFTASLVDLPPEQARVRRAELVAAAILSGCPEKTEGMSPEDGVKFVEDAMRLVQSVLRSWDRWDPT